MTELDHSGAARLHDVEVARRSLLFRSLSSELADTLLAHASERILERGQSLFVQGEPAQFIYVVLDGWVKLYRVARNGAEAVVGVFTVGRSFAEAVALQGGRYPVSAEAVVDCRLLQIRAQVILDEMRARPELAQAVLASAFSHMHRLVLQVEQLKAQTGAQRVAGFFVSLCPVREGACSLTLPYDKMLIASHLGLTPESLSRIFARLKDAGVTIRQTRVAIADVGRLRAYAEMDPVELRRAAR